MKKLLTLLVVVSIVALASWGVWKSSEARMTPLVIGGGIGGMNAALDLANQGIKVYLVEQKTTIGGRMSQLDRTFPTDDCAI